MPPTSSDPMAPGRVPRHAAGAPDGMSAADDARGRHRRPESLADSLPPPPPSSQVAQSSSSSAWADLVSSAPADPFPASRPARPGRSSPPAASGARSGWADLVPSSSPPDPGPAEPPAASPYATPAEPPAWSAYLAPAESGWAGSWASELGSTGSWQSGDVLPEPGHPEIAPEGHTATADSRDAWAFESTGEWLLSARRFRRPLAVGEPADAHPADAAIAAARSAAARLQQDRATDELDPATGAGRRATRRHGRAADHGGRTGRHGSGAGLDGPAPDSDGHRPPSRTDRHGPPSELDGRAGRHAPAPDTGERTPGRHAPTPDTGERTAARHGRDRADKDDRPTGGAHRAPEPKRVAPAWSRITGSLPILGRATAPADGAPAPRRNRAGRRRRAAETASPPDSTSHPSGGPAVVTPTDDSDVTRPDAGARTTGLGGRRAAARSGRHARPADPLAITVRPVPAVRDALQEGRRAAGAVREWALWTADRTPPAGTHRAPGTLPLESWLLIGRSRQQALLAALVAAGLALVLIPVQRAVDDVDPVTASGQSAVVAEREKAEREKKAGNTTPRQEPQSGRRGTAEKPAGTERGPEPKPGGTASGPAPTAQPPASAESPAAPVALPPGDGPARSLRFTGTQAVALTFDDGPDPVQTPRILAMLDEHGVTATFCLVGDQVRRHPDVVRQIVAAGHTLCNHSWDHSFTLGKQHPDVIRADLARTNEAIRAAVPDAKIPFFRAPGGNFTDRLVEVAYAGGMASLYWEVDPRDWDRADDVDSPAHVKKIVDDIRAAVRPGSIVLSHDFHQPDTITAYAELLPWLRDNFELGVPTVPPPVTPDASAPAPPPES
jgi:peptidoglycan/xylan/chitin deacetylase (PgdA/CDA1 family)